MVYIQTIIFFLLLMFLHELGHVLAAKYLGLSIRKIGFQMKPYPHFFVAASWPKTSRDKYIYLFSGIFITTFLFLISLSLNFFSLLGLYIAFVIQIAIETNPFYSDITIAIVSNSKKIRYGKTYAADYKKQFADYQFSKYWYIHFVFWTILIISLIKLNYLR